MARCGYETEKGRQCKLDSPHQGQHKFALPRPKLSEVIPTGFKLQPTTAKAVLTKTSGRTAKERDTEQKHVDGWASDAYTSWVKAGKPDFKDKEKRLSYMKDILVPPKAVPAVIALFNNATNSTGPVPGKTFRYTRGVHESGNTLIQYTVIDTPVRETASTK